MNRVCSSMYVQTTQRDVVPLNHPPAQIVNHIPPAMEHFAKYFQHCQEHRIIVCKACQIAVVPTQVSGHLKKKHPFTQQVESIEIQQYVADIEDVAQMPQEVDFPQPHQNPCHLLPIKHDGLRCTAKAYGSQCSQVCVTIKKMQNHCKTEHAWVNGQKRGGRSKSKLAHTANRMWSEGQAYQQFFAMPGWMRLTAVRATSSTGDANDRSEWSDDFVDNLAEKREAAINEARKKRQIDGNVHRLEATPWLQFVGWPQHLAGFTREELLLTIRPADDEPAEDGLAPLTIEDSEEAEGLSAASKATRRLIRRAFAASRPWVVGKPALESVYRRETGASTNERPFYAEQKVKTIRKYSRSWVKILRYIWRTASEEKRPEYDLTQEQEECLAALQQSVRSDQPRGGRKARIDDAVLAFWLAMFDDQVKDYEYRSGMMSGLAVLGLDVERGGWMPAVNYTPILSAVVTTARALVVYKAFMTHLEVIREQEERGMSKRDARRQAPAIVDEVDRMSKQFMTLREFGRHSNPLDRILRQRTYGMKIRYTTKAKGRVSWNGKRILIDQKEFDMDDIRSVVHGLRETVRKRLQADLLMVDDESTPRIDITRLVDNPVEFDEGWNFLHDQRNEFPVDGKRWLWRKVTKSGALRDRFIRGDMDEVRSWEDIRWNEEEVERYFRQVRRFKEELIVLVHLSAGAPARATELISIHQENGEEARSQRGIFMDDGMVSFVTSYHKGFSASQKSKVVHRYVPREVGELVVQYLWLAEPFVRQLQSMRGEQDEFTSWLWEPEPEEEWEAGEDEEEAAIEEIDEAAGKGGTRDGGGDRADEEEPDDMIELDDAEIELMARRGTQEAKGKRKAGNVDGLWNTDRVRRVMFRETESRIGVRIGVALWRQAYPAIQRELCKDPKVREVLDDIYETKPRTSTEQVLTMADVRAQQAGHGNYMEEMVYGLLMQESPFTTRTEQEQFRRVSVDWHRLLHFQSAFERGQKFEPEIQRQIQADFEKRELRRWKQMREIDVDVEIRRFYGRRDAEFRGKQREGLEAVVAGEPYITIIMRTGGGKSLVFMLPAFASKDGVTIVIVPMVALREDLWRRSSEAGIPCAEWDGERPPSKARIVFVTPESAVTAAFGRYIDEKRMTSQLERIVVDECHLILDVTDEFRPDMRKLREMAFKGVQVVYLTATLPPSDEPAFFAAIGVEQRQMHMIRESTIRPNIAYSIVQFEKRWEDEAVRELVERKLEEYPEPGKIIVYCMSKAQTERLGKVLNCPAFHARIGDRAVKSRLLKQLKTQEGRVFTATNALGIGVDVPTIRVVIHVGVCKRIKQYSQESGRAGRDGRASEAIIMQGTWTDGQGKTAVDRGGARIEGAMRRYIQDKKCRRIAIDLHIDGRAGRLGCENGEVRCDVCRGERREWTGRNMIVQHTQRSGQTKRRRTEDGLEVEGDRRVRREEADAREEEEEREEEGERVRAQEREEAREEEERQRVKRRRTEATFRQVEVREKQRRVEEAGADVIFEQRLRTRQRGCAFCQCADRESQDHVLWEDCPYEGEETKAKTRIIDMGMNGFKPEQFSGCGRCFVPQAICHAWEEQNGVGGQGWVFRKEKKCQFDGVIRSRVSAALSRASEEGLGEIMAFITEMADKKSILVRDTGSFWHRIGDWAKRYTRIGDLETNGLGLLFYELG